MGGPFVYCLVKYHSRWTRNKVYHCLEHIMEKQSNNESKTRREMKVTVVLSGQLVYVMIHHSYMLYSDCCLIVQEGMQLYYVCTQPSCTHRWTE